MKIGFLKSILAIVALCTAISPTYSQERSESPLTNAAVVKLVRAGFKEKTVIAIVRSKPHRFNLEPERLIELKRNGVSENIILAMLAESDPFFVSDADWSDDMLRKGNTRRSTNDPESPSGDGDIFGSTGGSKGQTRGRGMSGSNQAETTTTGSATVRILRPQSETGNAQLKLEKTPTLNNESIIKLVEAGFSEGTIVKRIEDSPADFDLSPPKLEDLRKRRVGDKVITAMTAAMADESETKQTAPVKSREK
jgi:hypothetical protein